MPPVSAIDRATSAAEARKLHWRSLGFVVNVLSSQGTIRPTHSKGCAAAETGTDGPRIWAETVGDRSHDESTNWDPEMLGHESYSDQARPNCGTRSTCHHTTLTTLK
jgi:hypothetical protein